MKSNRQYLYTAAAGARIVGRVGAERIVDFAYNPSLHPSAQELFNKEVAREMRRNPALDEDQLKLAAVERAEHLDSRPIENPF